jgi:hypothetical protein
MSWPKIRSADAGKQRKLAALIYSGQEAGKGAGTAGNNYRVWEKAEKDYAWENPCFFILRYMVRRLNPIRSAALDLFQRLFSRA